MYANAYPKKSTKKESTTLEFRCQICWLHPPLPARRETEPAQILLFLLLFHQLHVASYVVLSGDVRHRSLGHVSDFSVGFYGSWGRLKLHRIADFSILRERSKNSNLDARQKSRIFLSCQRMVAMWHRRLLIFVYTSMYARTCKLFLL